MTKKRNIIYIALSLSIGYLLYTYIFTDYGFYMMMNHHYGYYDNFSEMGYYLRSGLVFLSYTVLFISIIMLVLDKTVSKNNALTILDQRLSKGDISIDEYRAIKGAINTK